MKNIKAMDKLSIKPHLEEEDKIEEILHEVMEMKNVHGQLQEDAPLCV